MRRVKLNFNWLFVLIGFIAVVISPSHAVSLVDNFNIKVGTDNTFIGGEGTGYKDDGRWFYYPISNWWTQWFYNAPYNSNRKTVIDISFDVTYLNPSYPPVVKVAYNWATPEWSQLGKDHPPLPSDVPDSETEDEYIQRWAFANISIPPNPDPTHVEEHFEIYYNAEWVSVEVCGSNASIVNGTINHRCVSTEPEELDFGDAPDSEFKLEYPTLLSNNGARHVIGGPWLGDSADQPDAEADGQPDLALGDDDDGNDDENGVNIPPLVRGQEILITVDVNGGGGDVDAWIDFDDDQAWETGEKIISDFLSDGLHTIAVNVPGNAKVGQSFARFRISTVGGLDPTGEAPDGEVEDYEVEIAQLSSNAKWVQLPDSTRYGVDTSLIEDVTIGDDFVCTATGLVTGIRLWGSWRDDIKGQINNVTLSIHHNDPVGSSGSDPDNSIAQPEPDVLWTKSFGSGEFTESLYYIIPEGAYWVGHTSGSLISDDDTEVWQLDIDIDPEEAFTQQGSVSEPVIYWLLVREVSTINGEFGWKNRQWMQQSNGCGVRGYGSGIPEEWWTMHFSAGHPLQYRLMDMSFMLTSEEGPSVSNDDCADAEPIGNVTNKAFDTTGATFDGPGHCTHAPNIWYCYTATCTGDVTVSLCGSSYDTMLAVYDGCGCYPSEGDMIECNDDYCGWQSEITFSATEGKHYLIEIGGYGNETGQGKLSINCEAQQADNDDCDDAKSIGEVTDMSFDTTTATFDGPGHCTHAPNIWYCYTPSCTGNVTVSLCGSSYDTMLAVYDGCGCYPSQGDLIECNDDYCGWQSEITFAATAGSHYLIEIGGYGSENGQGVLNISCETQGLPNDDCADATPIGNTTNRPFDTTLATFDGPGHCTHAPNIWYCYTATCTGEATVSLCGSSYDTMLAVYDGCGCYPSQGDLIECNDDYCGWQSEITFTATAGSHYLIEIGGYGSENGQGVLNISCETQGLPNDDCDDATPIGNTTNRPFDTTLATFDGPGHCTHAPNIWYCYTATCTGEATVSLCGSSYDTMLAVYDGCGCYPSQSDLIECNDDFCGWQSEITFNATTGKHYLIEIGGYGSETGVGKLSISCEAVQVEDFDFGDAPQAPYLTTLSANGARHLVPSSPQMYLGAGVDVDLDGQPNATATGDDNDGNDDEDGVTFTSQLVPGQTANVKISASKTGRLDAWVDFDGNGKWIDAGDKIFSSQLLSAGLNSLSFSVPSTATLGITTFARFRFSTAGGLNYYGSAPDGEVEDYSVTIGYEPEPTVEHIKWSQPPIEIDPRSETPVFCGWDEPSYFSYAGGACVVIENFEDGDIAEYSVPSGDTHSVTAAAAHDGAYGLEDSNPGTAAKWIYRDDPDVQVAQGDTISYWVKLLDDETLGRAYCGFGATAGGTYCIIAAANSNTFLIQKNVGYSYNTIGSVSQYWASNKWYRLEVEWGIGGDIVGNLYDSDGTTLLNTVTASSDTYTSGGIAFRGFEHVYVDTVERCKPSVVQISVTSAASMMSNAQAKVVELRDPGDAVGWDSDNEASIFDDIDETDTAPSISSSAVKKTAEKVSAEVSDLDGTSSAGAGVYAKRIRATKLASGNQTLVIETRMGISGSVLAALDSFGHSYDFVSTDNLSSIDFSPYTTVILGMDGGQADEADMDHLADHIETGAKLILLGGTNYISFAQGLNNNFIKINTAVRSWRKVSGSPDIKVVSSTDSLASGLPSTYNFANDNASYYMARITDSTAKTIVENGDGYPCLVTKAVDAGELIFFINSPNEDYWSGSGDLEILKTILKNALSISNVTGRVVADDFRCLGNIPISSIHWWGSYQSWDGAEPPQDQPVAWQIAFWSNTPADLEGDTSFSRPNTLLWQVEVAADTVNEQKVGSDQFPQRPSDTCFEYYVQLDPEEYFWQDPNDGDIFWISISAIYSGDAPSSYVWGWKTRPQPWMDCAVTFSLDGTISPGKVLDPLTITPIKDSALCGEPQCYDMAFELDTDPDYLKYEQPFTGLRQWSHYEDEESLGINVSTTEQVFKYVQEAHLSSLAIDVDATKTNTSDTWPTQILADDFPCTTTGPLTNIRVWGAWYSDVMPDGDPESVTFTLSIYEDIPASESTTGYSTPGSLLWRKDFKKGQFTVSEYEDYLYSRWMVPCTVPQYYQSVVDKTCWQYDFNIDSGVAFNQQGSPGKQVIYWLAVQVKPETQSTGRVRFGWKSTRSSLAWNDIAVWAQGSQPAPNNWGTLKNPRTGARIDLAFAVGTGQATKELQISRLVADDWLCEQRDPITAVAWWGSYIDYEFEACQCQQQPSPTKPDYFLLSIWTDEPYPISTLSHPGQKIWEYKAYDYDEVMVGYDKYPLSSGTDLAHEPVFRYSVRLPEEDWFCQEDVDEVYWFSVVAVYDESTAIEYPWGWTNHPHNFGNGAVSGYRDQQSEWTWQQLLDQTDGSEDMSFVLFSESEECVY